MGLDIFAKSKIEIEQSAEIKAIREKLFISQGEEVVEISAEGPIEYTTYTEDMEAGVYYETSESKSAHTRFSYSGYNSFRNQLSLSLIGVPAKTVWSDPELYKDSPAFKVINFSDCEGLFGPTVSKEIHEQLVANRDKFESQLNEESVYGLDSYDTFTEIFKLGSDNGIVMFH